MKQRWQPLQDTSGNISTSRSDRSKPYPQGGWEQMNEQQDVRSNRVRLDNRVPAQDSIIQSSRAYLDDGTPDILHTISRYVLRRFHTIAQESVCAN